MPYGANSAWKAPRTQPATIVEVDVRSSKVPFVMATVAQFVSTAMIVIVIFELALRRIVR